MASLIDRANPLGEALKGASSAIAGGSQPAEQVELFGLPCDDPTGRIGEARERGAKGGRPKGAQNIATRELRDWLLRRGVLPQQAMMEWLMLGPEGLALALACSKLEAFDRWSKLASDLGRYFMAPMQPVDAEGRPAPQFLVQIGGVSGVVDASGEVRPPWEYLAEQDQGLTAEAGEPSKDEASQCVE